jgi:hypothetical protein
MTAEEFIKQAHDQSKGKVCSKCKEHKLLSEFDKGIRHKDGLQYQCKSCIKEYKDNVPMNIELAKERHRNEGWTQALRLVLEKNTYPISNKHIEEKNVL